jgi:hypothetical protein
MKDVIKRMSAGFRLDPAASVESLQQLRAIKGIELPEDYRSFLAEANGGEGFVGREYLILWKVQELESFNREYEVERYAPGLFLFGSNGSGEGFAFDTRETPYKVVQVPFIGMSLECATDVADSFLNLLERMSRSDGSLL